MAGSGDPITAKPGGHAHPAAEAADRIRNGITAFAAESLEDRHREIDDSPIFDAPLVGFADGDDPLFTRYKEIIGNFHLTPREVLGLAPSAAGSVEAVSVICWALPVSRRARLSNRRRELTPSLRWAHTRLYGERFNDRLRDHVVSLVRGLGYAGVAPLLTTAFKTVQRENGPASTWSERHAAYAAGLGTFSLSDGLITPAGVAMRCGSVVTDLPLAASERKYADHLANCLYYREGSCGNCIDRCPAGAITMDGHDKRKCRAYLLEGLEGWDRKYGTEDIGYVGCGLCQTGVPCESGIPASASSGGAPAFSPASRSRWNRY